ncbi:MAG: O-antigen ligase family protein [Planctomycetota bacterium JB042]
MILLAAGLALALAVPLVAPVHSFIFAFVVPKVLVLRGAALVAGLGWLVLWTRDRGRHGVRATPITVAFALFVASAVASTVGSVDVHRSIWDTPERMLGVVTLAALLGLYLASTHGLRSELAWRRVLGAFLVVGAVVVHVAVAQKVDPDLFANRGNPRVSATLGHPTYLAGVGVFQVAVGAYLAATARNVLLRGLAAFAAALGLVGVALAESRGPMLGLAVGGLVAVVLTAVVAGPGRVRRGSLVLAGSAVVLGLAALPILGLERDVQLLEHELTSAAPGERPELRRELERKRAVYDALYRVPGVRRFLRASVTKKTADTRLMKWEVAGAAFRARPILGYGPNGYAAAYDHFHPTRAILYGSDEVWVDDAHNVLLNVLAEQGIVGLVATLLLLGAPVLVSWRAFRRGRVGPALPVFVTGFTAAHLVHLFFVFENPTSWLYVVLLLAYVNARTSVEPASTGPPARGRGPLVAAGALAAIGLAAWLVAIPARANVRLYRTIGLVHDGRAEEAGAALDDALAAGGPHRRAARDLFAASALEVIDEVTRLSRAADTPEKKARIERIGVAIRPILVRAFDELGANVDADPTVRPVVRRAQLAILRHRRYRETEPLDPVAGELDRAIARAPGRADLRLLRADVAFAVERPAEAIEPLRGLIERADDVGGAWWRLVFARQAAGDVVGARESLAAATATGHGFDDLTRRNLEALRQRLEPSEGSGGD